MIALGKGDRSELHRLTGISILKAMGLSVERKNFLRVLYQKYIEPHLLQPKNEEPLEGEAASEVKDMRAEFAASIQKLDFTQLAAARKAISTESSET